MRTLSLETLRAEDCLLTSYERVSEEEPLSKALARFREVRGLEVLVVEDAKGNYKGILTERCIVRSRLNPTRFKAKHALRRVPRLRLHDNVFRMVRLMLESDVKHLPVFEDSKLRGVVSTESLLELVAMTKIGAMRAKDVMTKDVICVSEDTSIGVVMRIMRQNEISRVPVLDAKGRLTGIIAVHDIVCKLIQPRDRAKWGEVVGEKVHPLSIAAKHLMTSPVITSPPDDELRRIIEKMLSHKITDVVIAEDSKVKGIITQSDVLGQVLLEERVSEPVFSISKGQELESIDEVDISSLRADVKKVLTKFREFLSRASLSVYVKRHKEQFRGLHLYHVRVRLVSPRGSVVTTAEAWGLEYALHQAMRKLTRLIEELKEREMLERRVSEKEAWERWDETLRDFELSVKS